jgi:hypothetical protein
MHDVASAADGDVTVSWHSLLPSSPERSVG